jgi:DNA-directed RNA polymerase specialized sigma24 family protein
MNQAEQVEVFKQALLSHAEMCFSVAFALTRDPDRAQDLAAHVLTRAWQLRDSVNGRHDVKKTLLTALRKRYLEVGCGVRAGRNDAVLAGGA